MTPGRSHADGAGKAPPCGRVRRHDQEDRHWEVLIVEAVLRSHREQAWVDVQG